MIGVVGPILHPPILDSSAGGGNSLVQGKSAQVWCQQKLPYRCASWRNVVVLEKAEETYGDAWIRAASQLFAELTDCDHAVPQGCGVVKELEPNICHGRILG